MENSDEEEQKEWARPRRYRNGHAPRYGDRTRT